MYYYRPKIGNYIKTLILLILVFSTISCASKTTVIDGIDLDKKPRLLFINYTLSKANSETTKVDYINHSVVDGKLKHRSNKFIAKPSIGDLKCTQLDKKSSPLYSVFIKNPFIKFIEVVDDSLNFKMRQVRQNNVPLSLRLQLHPNTKYIEISKVLDTLEHTKKLIKTTLE